MNQNYEANSKGKSSIGAKVAIGGAAGILLGAAPVVLGSFISQDDAVDGGNEPAGASGELDDMSFADAFTAARGELGPGEVFEWHGNLYSTNTVAEWEAEHPVVEDIGITEDETSSLDYEDYSEDDDAAVIIDEDSDEVEVIGVDGIESVDDNSDIVMDGMTIDGQDVYVMDLGDEGEVDGVDTDFTNDVTDDLA